MRGGAFEMNKLAWDIKERMGESVHSRICGGGVDSVEERAQEQE